MKHFSSVFTAVFITLMMVLALSSTAVEESKDLKELKKELGSLSGEKKVNRLNLLSAKTLKKSIEESMTYCREALKLARELKYVKGEASALIGHAKCYREMKKYERALEYFQQALKLFTTINSLQDIGQLGHTKITPGIRMNLGFMMIRCLRCRPIPGIVNGEITAADAVGASFIISSGPVYGMHTVCISGGVKIKITHGTVTVG